MNGRARASGWVAVFVLFAAYAVSFVDRQIVGLLVEPIKASLAISDTRIGLLQGPAFGLFYTILGVPLGWLADRTHRVRLIAAGITLWSVMTVFCGLATSFEMLFLARMGVGIGEAVLVPAGISLLADRFGPQDRALPMSVFTSGLSLGAGMALLLGGWFVAFAGHGAAALPLIGAWLTGMQPWQVAFVLAGLLGLPVALAVLLLDEPARGGAEDANGPPAGGSALAYLRGSWLLFLPMLGGTAMLYLFSNALSAWMPTLFIRQHGWSAAEVGVRLGLLIMGCAMAGNLASGLLATHLARRGMADAPLRPMLLGSALMLPAAALACLAGDPAMVMAGFMLLYFGVALCFGVATTAFVTITPPPLRARVVAIYLLVGNLLGLGLGPPSVGLLLDHLLHDPTKVGLALAIVAAPTLLLGLMLLWVARRGFALRATELARPRCGAETNGQPDGSRID